jgi:ribosomal protein L21
MRLSDQTKAKRVPKNNVIHEEKEERRKDARKNGHRRKTTEVV